MNIQKQIDDAILKRSGRGCFDHSFTEQTILPKGSQYEYLNHPADVQIHSWGDSMQETLCNAVMAMFGYMTSISLVKINEEESLEFGQCMDDITGHDLYSLIYSFLDEWLFNFHSTGFIAKETTILDLDLKKCTIQSCAKGECFDVEIHPQFSEIKAITYSSMKMKEINGRWHLWVIVDI